MKRIALLVLSALLCLGSVNAQEEKPKRPERVSYEKMTKKMVAELQLNEQQKKKLAKLNKKYRKLIEGEQQERPQGERPPMGKRPSGGPGGGGMPGGGFGGMGGPGGGFGGGMPGGGMHGGGPRGGMPGGEQQEKAYDYDKKQEKYDKALCKFLTEEQYEGYKKLKPQFYSQRRIRDFLFGGQPAEMPRPFEEQ
ncbi:hypothetical protein [Xylanibacter ruminicola]|uniref:DUF4890 domain-containing protein n=1 Tax=Xylanibacter ruminicola TaxID=839 RepID=A0A1M6TJ48_XYLRU|nr:hypothetical protein [Xylanibacter ruminicola]SHK57015.1 hypothetical protein SAMN05216463_10646 [Xylanibacter ruminicola]